MGVEELGHLEMVASIVQQLTRDMTIDEIKAAGMEPYFVDHTAGVYPQFASGTPWTAATIAVKGDVITSPCFGRFIAARMFSRARWPLV